MKFRLKKSIINTSWIIFLAIIAILSYFTELDNFIKDLLRYITGIPNPIIIDVISLVLYSMFIIILVFLISRVQKRKGSSIIEFNYESNLKSVLSSDSSGIRISDFQQLTSKAKKSLIVMGIGMTNFSRDLKYLESILIKNKLNIRILMIDPKIIVERSFKNYQKFPFFITKENFHKYFDRKGYRKEIRLSHDRIKTYIENRLKNPNRSGKIEFRVYRDLVPMNFTTSDENSPNSQMIIEYCLPFSDNRLRFPISKSENGHVFQNFLDFIENLWRKSHLTSKDF